MAFRYIRNLFRSPKTAPLENQEDVAETAAGATSMDFPVAHQATSTTGISPLKNKELQREINSYFTEAATKADDLQIVQLQLADAQEKNRELETANANLKIIVGRLENDVSECNKKILKMKPAVQIVREFGGIASRASKMATLLPVTPSETDFPASDSE